MSRNISVLHVLGSLDVGGAEHRALDLCSAIERHEVHQTFLCLSGRRGVLAERFEALGADVLPIRARPSLRFGLQLVETIKRVSPTTVVSHVSLASGIILTAAWVAGVNQRIARIHSTGDGKPNTLRRRAYRFVTATLTTVVATQVLGVTQASVDLVARHTLFRKMAIRKSQVLPNGVDLEAFRSRALDLVEPGQPREMTILYVGRASPEKNRKLLVPILNELNRLRPTKMVVVGPGGTEDLGASELPNLEIHGARNDIAAVMGAGDVLVLTSVREGLPSVILEALASGLPVVSSDLATIRELSESLSGITLVDLDEPAAVWAQALVSAYESRVETGAAARSELEASPFALTTNARIWKQIWTNP